MKYWKHKEMLMNSIIDYSGLALETLSAPFNSILFGAAVFSLFASLLIIPLLKKTVYNYCISVIVRDDSIRKRGNLDDRGMINSALAASGYSLLVTVLLPLVKALLAAIISLGFKSAYVSELLVGRIPVIFSCTMMEIYKNQYTGFSILPIMLFLTCFMSMTVINRSESVSLIRNRRLSCTLLLITMGLSLLLPLAYAYAYMLLTVIEFLYFKIHTESLYESTTVAVRKYIDRRSIALKNKKSK